MDNESKKPCAPVEEESRDYDALGLFRREGDNETLMAAMGLWEFLPAWMDARRIALVDPDYNRKISAMVADLAGTVQKAAQEMAEWGQEECAPAGWNKFQRDTAGLKHQIKGGCTHFAILEADLVCMVTASAASRPAQRSGERYNVSQTRREAGCPTNQKDSVSEVKFVEAYQRITSFLGGIVS